MSLVCPSRAAPVHELIYPSPELLYLKKISDMLVTVEVTEGNEEPTELERPVC